MCDVRNPGRCGELDAEGMRMGKDLLVRIVAMLTRMIERGSQVREGDAVYGYVYVYVYGSGNERQSGQPEGPGDSQWLAPDLVVGLEPVRVADGARRRRAA
jgi:hypothetical protein